MQHSLSLPEHKKIILFDGVCNLCNSAVQTIIQHDKKDVFRFVALTLQRSLAEFLAWLLLLKSFPLPF